MATSRNLKSRYEPPLVSVPIGPFHHATPDGRVFSTLRGKFLSAGIGTNGRPHVAYRRFGESGVRTGYLHVIVCEAFHGPRPEGMEASHLNGDMLDCRAENLAWETPGDNRFRKREHGTHDAGFANSRASVTPGQVAWIRDNSERLTHQAMADKVGVSRTTVSRIVNRHRFNEEDA